jgi:hypothetical protein
MAKAEPLSLNELTQLLPRLQATVESLRDMAGAARASRGTRVVAAAPAKAIPRGKNSRDAAHRLRVRIPAFLSTQKQGAAIGKIAKGVSASPEAVRYALKLLRDDKTVRMTGSRATARWHAR